MLKVRGHVMVLVMFVAQLAIAQQQSQHWLIGRWDGTMEGFTGKGVSFRFLRVHEVSADGAALSLWGIPDQSRGRAEVKVDGSQVSVFIPSTKTKVELTRTGNDLVGKVAFANGSEFPVKLGLAQLSNKFDGKYTGTSRGDVGCGSIFYEIVVKDSLITGWARLQGSRDGGLSGANSDGVITGEVNNDGAALIESRGFRNSQFSRMFTLTGLTATDPPAGKSQCSYSPNLSRR